MATATLAPLPHSSSPTFEGADISTVHGGAVVPVGTTDRGQALITASDSKYLTTGSYSRTGGGGTTAIGVVYFNDDASIPLDATIVSVQLTAVHRNSGGAVVDQYIISFTSAGIFLPLGTLDFSPAPGASFSAVNLTSALATNPVTGLAWTRAQLFDDGDAGLEGNGSWYYEVSNTGAGSTGTTTYDLDQFQLVVTYSSSPSLWYYNPRANEYRYAEVSPGPDWIEVPAPSPTLIAVSPTSGT